MSKQKIAKPVKPIKAWAMIDTDSMVRGQYGRNPAILVYNCPGQLAGRRKDVVAHGLNDWNDVIPVIIVPAEHYRVVRKPAKKRSKR